MTLKQKRAARRTCRERHGNKCLITGETVSLSVHHVIPLNYGGGWGQHNLVLIANRLHVAIHNNTLDGLTTYEIQAVRIFQQIIQHAKRGRRK